MIKPISRDSNSVPSSQITSTGALRSSGVGVGGAHGITKPSTGVNTPSVVTNSIGAPNVTKSVGAPNVTKSVGAPKVGSDFESSRAVIIETDRTNNNASKPRQSTFNPIEVNISKKNIIFSQFIFL